MLTKYNNCDSMNHEKDVPTIDDNLSNEQIQSLICVYEIKAQDAVGPKKIIYNQIVKMLKSEELKWQPSTEEKQCKIKK